MECLVSLINAPRHMDSVVPVTPVPDEIHSVTSSVFFFLFHKKLLHLGQHNGFFSDRLNQTWLQR
jgi:hypothetical protein